MAELTVQIRRFLHDNEIGVVATEGPDGLPRQTVVYHLFENDTLTISTVADRAKTRDVERTGRASYAVMGHARPYPQVVITGTARIRREDIADATTRIFTRALGQPAEGLTDEVLAGMGRVLLEITVDRVAAVSYLPEA